MWNVQGCLRANDFSGGVDDYCDLGEVLGGGGGDSGCDKFKCKVGSGYLRGFSVIRGIG